MNTTPVSNPTTTPVRPSRKRAWLVLTLVFLLGAGSGIGGGLLVLRGVLRKAFAGESGAGPVERVIHRMEDQVSSDLDLTPAERAGVHRELAVTIERFKELRGRVRSDSRSLVEDSIKRIEPHLAPEKRGLLRERAAEKLRPWKLMD